MESAAFRELQSIESSISATLGQEPAIKSGKGDKKTTNVFLKVVPDKKGNIIEGTIETGRRGMFSFLRSMRAGFNITNIADKLLSLVEKCKPSEKEQLAEKSTNLTAILQNALTKYESERKDVQDGKIYAKLFYDTESLLTSRIDKLKELISELNPNIKELGSLEQSLTSASGSLFDFDSAQETLSAIKPTSTYEQERFDKIKTLLDQKTAARKEKNPVLKEKETGKVIEPPPKLSALAAKKVTVQTEKPPELQKPTIADGGDIEKPSQHIGPKVTPTKAWKGPPLPNTAPPEIRPPAAPKELPPADLDVSIKKHPPIAQPTQDPEHEIQEKAQVEQPKEPTEAQQRILDAQANARAEKEGKPLKKSKISAPPPGPPPPGTFGAPGKGQPPTELDKSSK